MNRVWLVVRRGLDPLSRRVPSHIHLALSSFLLPWLVRAYTAIHIIPCISWASLNSSFLSSLHLSAYCVHKSNLLARRRIVALLGREEPQTHIDKIDASDFAQEHPSSFFSASPPFAASASLYSSLREPARPPRLRLAALVCATLIRHHRHLRKLRLDRRKLAVPILFLIPTIPYHPTHPARRCSVHSLSRAGLSLIPTDHLSLFSL